MQTETKPLLKCWIFIHEPAQTALLTCFQCLTKDLSSMIQEVQAYLINVNNKQDSNFSKDIIIYAGLFGKWDTFYNVP